MEQQQLPKTKKFVTVTLTESTADSIKSCLEILRATFEAEEKAMFSQGGSEHIQKLLHKLDHRLDQDGQATGVWL